MKRRDGRKEEARLERILRQISAHPGARRVALGLLGRAEGNRQGEVLEAPHLG